MNLQTIVKVGSVNNLSDARYCAGMGVQYIGFEINDNGVTTDSYKEIVPWLEGVEFVLEFNQEDMNAITPLVEELQPNGVQHTSLSILKQLPENITKFFKINFEEIKNAESLFNEVKDIADFIIIDSQDKLSFKEETLNQIKGFAQNYSILMGTGFNSENVIDFINTTAIKGLSLKGGNEERPGWSNFDELADVLEVLDEEYSI